MERIRRGLGLLLASGVLLLAACVSPGGHGGHPGGYGQAPGRYPSSWDHHVQGTVEGLDRSYGRILLVVDDARSGRAGRMEVRYDQRTRLYHQGREAAVEGLERGDVVRIDVAQSGRDLLARSVEVLRDVRDRGPGGGGIDAYDDMRGTVAFVDTRVRLIGLGGDGYGRDRQLRYDSRTTVEYQGRLYRPEDLDRGDQVRIQARRLGNGEWLAERIVVERSVRR